MDTLPPTLNLTLTLSAKLARHLDPISLRASVTEDGQSLLDHLGIPVQLATAVAEPTSLTGFSLTISLDGQPLWFADQLLHRVYHWLQGVHLGITGLWPAVAALSPTEATEFVRLACQEILRSQPQLLLTPSGAARYRGMLANHLGDKPLDVAWLHRVLTAVLQQRLSLANVTAVARGLAEAGIHQAAATEAIITALRPAAIKIHWAPAYLQALTTTATPDDEQAFDLMRDGLFYELGIHYPDIVWVIDASLPPGSFYFQLNDLPTLPWRGLEPEQRLVNDTPDRLRLLSITGQPFPNPANRHSHSIIPAAQADAATAARLTVWTPWGFLILALSAELRQQAACFFSQANAAGHLDDLQTRLPALITAVYTRYDLPTITQVLRQLLAEALSMRNLRQVLQAMLDFDYIVADSAKHIIFDARLSVQAPPTPAWLNDPANITAYVRTMMKNYISHKYTRGQSTLIVYLLDPTIEQRLLEHAAAGAQASLANLSAAEKEEILTAVADEITYMPADSQVSVLTTSEVRPVFHALIASRFPHLPVVAYQELSPWLNIQPIARISL